MALFDLNLSLLVGNGIPISESVGIKSAKISIAPAYRIQLDDTQVNWPVVTTYETNEASLTIPALQDEDSEGEKVVWQIRVDFLDRKGSVAGGEGAKTFTIPDGATSPLNYPADVTFVDPDVNPEYGPTWAAQAMEARDEALAARDDAEAAKAAAEAVGSTNDTIIAGRISTPGSATDTALKATYAPTPTDVPEWAGGTTYPAGKRVARAGRLWEHKAAGSNSSFVPSEWRYLGRIAGGWGNTAVLLGNSRFALERTTSADASTQQRGAMYWANLFLGARLNIVNYAGVSGDVLTGMATRWETAVAPYVPDMVFLRDAVNDISAGASLADCQNRYAALFALNRSIGARSIVFTSQPRDANDSARNIITANLNRWLQSQTAPDLLVIDVTTPIMATASQAWGTNFATDGLHQSRRGAAREGLRIFKALDPIIPARAVLPVIPSDTTTNLMVNSFCAGTPGTGVPSSWAVFPAQGVGVTYSMVAPTDQTPGNWVQSDTATTSVAVYISQKVTIGSWATPGTTYVRGVVEMESDAWTSTLGGTGDVGVRLYMQFIDAGNAVISFRAAGEYYYASQVGDGGDATAFPLETQPGVGRPVVFETVPMLIPANATQVTLLAHSTVAGKVRWRKFGVLKA